MPFELPETVNAYGRKSVVMVQDLENPASPTLTELNAATSLNVSCFLYSGGAGTVTTNKVTAPRKICTRSTFEQRGTSTVAVTDISYSHHPQKPLNDPANAAKEALVDGSLWYMVERDGLDGDTDLVLGDYVNVWRVELLNQNHVPTGDGEDGEFSILQPVIAKADPIYDVQIVA